ncbi:MAG: DUF4435 domain-containing protein, partial [Chloroflexi bacterium]|nr:DUF4435 domain-containing protein [Chloroflexota bacterium]
MREYLTSADLHAYVRMLQSADERSLLLVEGDSDFRILRPHVDDAACSVVIGYGKHSVVFAIQSMDRDRVDGVAGLIDRDFDDDAQMYQSPNLFRTTLYDLETDLLIYAGLLAHFVASTAHV